MSVGVRLLNGSPNQKDRAEDAGRVRTAILAALAGILAAIGAYYTPRTFQLNRATLAHTRTTADRNHALGQDWLITDRFTQAIAQLGTADSPHVRLGGIYALERIARDSSGDHPQVIEVLTAFVREQRASADPSQDPANGERLRPPADIQAAITVVGRRETSSDTRILDLTEARLERAFLSRAHLEGARYDGHTSWPADFDQDARGAIRVPRPDSDESGAP